ncbi:MAG: TolC family protein [Burkholderiaceae bacterium]
MPRRIPFTYHSFQTVTGFTLVIIMSAAALTVHAQTAVSREPVTMRQVFEAAWSRQPEAAALSERREAARAQQLAAKSWTPEPIAAELAATTDRLNRNLGTREYEVGISIPLWLPGERRLSQAQADSEGRVIDSQTKAAQLKVAAAVREAWWNLQRARAELDTVLGLLDNANRLAADVNNRFKAGDLAQGDLYQADGAVAAAESAVAQAQADAIGAGQNLRMLAAVPALNLNSDRVDYSPEPDPGEVVADPHMHGELLALSDRVALAKSTAALTATQTRANPELTVATTRDRGAFGETWQQTIMVGVRIPFGAGARHEARAASARAETIELDAQLQLEWARLKGLRESAKARINATRVQLEASDRRARLARESRGFFEKSFLAGETDLPTRLRIEAEAADAERQAASARIEHAAAISQWRQSLGLLPQ